VFSTISILQPWATNLASGLIGALIGGVISFIGALIGAKMQASTSFEVQRKDFASRNESAKLSEQNLIRGAVQAISDEIESLWRQYYREIGPHLASVSQTEAARPFPVNQSYFVIFDASGALLGRIPDTSLRTKILDFYNGAKAMVDSLQHYTRLSAYYFTLDRNHPNAQKTWDEMLFYTGQLKRAHIELERLYKEVRPELNKYLIR
jgi:gas vesicle protein